MTRKEILVSLGIVLLIAVLVFLGYKDYLRQQRLKEEAGGLSMQHAPAETPAFSRAGTRFYFV